MEDLVLDLVEALKDNKGEELSPMDVHAYGEQFAICYSHYVELIEKMTEWFGSVLFQTCEHVSNGKTLSKEEISKASKAILHHSTFNPVPERPHLVDVFLEGKDLKDETFFLIVDDMQKKHTLHAQHLEKWYNAE